MNTQNWRDKNYDLDGENKGRMKRGKAGMVVEEVEGGGLVFFKLGSTYCYFAWVAVVACIITVSLIHFGLSLPNYTDVPNADSCGTSHSSNIHTTSRRVNV
jgi:hypothetical protein